MNRIGDLRRENGVAMTEFSLVLPLLILLLVGIIEFGLFFNDVISVRQGARDGVRNVAVGNFGSNTSCATAGSLTPAQNQVACLVKTRDDANDEETRVRIVVGDSTSGAYQVGRPVTICEQYAFRSITGLIGVLVGKTMTTRTTLRVEVTNSGGLTSGSETPLSGTEIPCPTPQAVSS
jgi:Flp pilus assembly protein TadG